MELQRLNLNSNNFSAIPDFHHLPLAYIGLFDNPLVCNHSLCWIRMYPWTKPQLNIDDARCSSPQFPQWILLTSINPVILDCQHGKFLLQNNLPICLVWKSGLNGHLTRYVKLWVTHAPGMPGTFSSPPRVSYPNMHHDPCVTHVPWCRSGSPTSGFRWGQRRGKRSRHSRRVCNPQFYIFGKRPTTYITVHRDLTFDMPRDFSRSRRPFWMTSFGQQRAVLNHL